MFDQPIPFVLTEADSDSTASKPAADTLPQWLRWRLKSAASVAWDDLSVSDRAYWEILAESVRAAVKRGGFGEPDSSPAETSDACTYTDEN